MKKAQKKIHEKEIADHQELETDFSQDLKDLKPKATIEGEIRQQQIPLEKLQMFIKSDREFLKKFDFSQSDINDAQILDLMKLLARDKDVYSQDKYDVGKTLKQKIHVKILPNSTLTKQRPSRVPLHHQAKLEILLEQVCKAGIFRDIQPPRRLVEEFLNNAPHSRPNPYTSLVHHHPLCWPPHRSPPPSPHLTTLHHKQVYTATQKKPAARVVAWKGATWSETRF